MPTVRKPRVGKKRASKTLPSTPAGQVARVLREELEKRGWQVSDLYDALVASGAAIESRDTVYKWVAGDRLDGFKLNHMEAIATALGYKDWASLARRACRT